MTSSELAPYYHTMNSNPLAFLRPVARIVLIAALSLAAGRAPAFNLSDHAVKAFIRPPERVALFEAEECPGVPASAITNDPGAANGKAVHLKPLAPLLTFKRHFERGTYTVWCIGRTREKPSEYREPLFVQLTLTGPTQDRRQQWRMRINYMTIFQDVAHLYFDINEPGDYDLAFCLGPDSRFDLIVDRLELRDVLAGTWRKGYKTESTMSPPPPALPALSPATAFPKPEAIQRARDMAGAFPPRNAILAAGGMPTEGWYHEFQLSEARLAEPTADRWMWKMNPDLEKPWQFTGPTLPPKDELGDALERADARHKDEAIAGMSATVNAPARSFGDPPAWKPDINWATDQPGSNAVYTAADFAEFRKVPGRWPDDGGGYYIPKALIAADHDNYFNWMAVAFKSRIFAQRDRISQLADDYVRTGDPKVGFRGALMLAFFADHFPSLDHTVQGTLNTIWGIYPFNDFTGRHAGEFGKIDYSGWDGPNNVPPILAYDKLFPAIRDNQLLADAIGSVLPWVKTPADVIELIDVKLVQHFYDEANRGIVRFDLRCDPAVAIVQGNNPAGRAMLHRIVFESDLSFPAMLHGLVIGHSRDATSFIGSMFYAKGPAWMAGASIADVTAFGARYGLPEFDLTGPNGSPLLFQAAQWLIEPYITGIHIPGVGDVSGPQGYPTMASRNDPVSARILLAAWQRYGDPRFAWMIVHVYNFPPGADEALQAKVRAAAATLAGDPRVNQPSRVLEGFGVNILEVNGANPDFKKRTGLVMRTGYGSGHSHSDQLNLEIFSKGIIAAAEFGGRGGYGTPGTSLPECHCEVAVDGSVAGYGRTTLLADLPGFPCSEGVGGRVRRFTALIDAGGDDAYVFDVVRASGGKKRTYWFHGNETEQIDADETRNAMTSVENVVKGKPGDDLVAELQAEKNEGESFKWSESTFSHSVQAEDRGRVKGDTYQAVWPLGRTMEASILNKIGGSYPFADGVKPASIYNPMAPRKFTRLILMGSKGRKIDTISAWSQQVMYRILCAGASEEAEPAVVSLFPAVIEPFEKSAFITGTTPLAISPDGEDKPWAVEVAVREDRKDVFYQSTNPAVLRSMAGATPLKAAAVFAFVSKDSEGLRACALVAGTTLECGDVALAIESPSYAGRLIAVDQAAQTAVLDRELPGTLAGPCYFKIGPDEELFRVTRLEPTNGATILHFQKTAETYRSPVFLVRDGHTVVGPFEPEHIQSGGWLTAETGKGWPLDAVESGDFRWMGMSFRGGAKMGYPLTDNDVPDTDGDGKRTLTISAHGDWQEPMRVEVLQVYPALRAIAFTPLNTPKGCGGTRSYAGGTISNEAGRELAISVYPGKMGVYRVRSDKPLRESDFTDADGNGSAEFKVYYFGPGDPASIQTQAGLVRQADGVWLVTANAPVSVRIKGWKSVELMKAGLWQPLPSTSVNGMLAFNLDAASLSGGQARVRFKK